MIINGKDAAARLNSPLNLINKLRERKNGSGMDLFTGRHNGNSNHTEKSEDNKPSSFINPFAKPEIKKAEAALVPGSNRSGVVSTAPPTVTNSVSASSCRHIR
jgi:hypothetical protein